MRKEKTYDVLSIQRENDNGTKILGNNDMSKETKGKKDGTRVAVWAPVWSYRRTIEQRAAGLMKA